VAALSALRDAAMRPGRVVRVPMGMAAGVRLEIDDNGSVHTYLGTAELELARHVRRAARPGAVCFDVGGHDGWYAMIFARLTGAPVVSFEADASAVERIRRNLGRNPSLLPLVTVRHEMVGEDTIDRLVADGTVPAPSLLKVDVDGGEVAVLRGARQVLVDHRPHVIVETHTAGLERDCGDLLVEAGYRPLIVPQRKRFRQKRPAAHNRWLVAHP
jgi:hypothetical protein